MLPVEVAGRRKRFHLGVGPVVDAALGRDAHRGVGELSWWALIRWWVDGGVTGLGGHGTRHLGVEARIGDHALVGQACGGDERLGHAHGHGDHVGQGKHGLCVGGPHVRMLSPGGGQGETVAAARTRGLAQRTWGANRREDGVTGHPRERRVVVGQLGGLWRARVGEWEVAVGRVVLLVVRQGGGRMVVVVVVMERRA